MKRCQGLRQATPHGVCSHFQVLHQRQSQHLCHLDALPIGLQSASPVSLLHNLFDWQGAPCLRNDICKQWRCSVLLCMPILALAADALLHSCNSCAFLVATSTGACHLSHIAWMASGIAPSPGQRHGQGLPIRLGTITPSAATVPAARQEEQCWTQQRHFEFHQICLMQQVCPVRLQATLHCMLAALSAVTCHTCFDSN